MIITFLIDGFVANQAKTLTACDQITRIDFQLERFINCLSIVDNDVDDILQKQAADW